MSTTTSGLKKSEEAICKNYTKYLTCPISLLIFNQPVVLTSGITVEKEMADELFKENQPRCPIKRESIKKEYTPNLDKKSQVEEYLELYPKINRIKEQYQPTKNRPEEKADAPLIESNAHQNQNNQWSYLQLITACQNVTFTPIVYLSFGALIHTFLGHNRHPDQLVEPIHVIDTVLFCGACNSIYQGAKDIKDYVVGNPPPTRGHRHRN